MDEGDSSCQQLYDVFPENIPKEILMERLKEHGMKEDILSKIQNKTEELVLCFYKNIASLPRRTPRENRRGKFLRNLQKNEDLRQSETSYQLTKISDQRVTRKCKKLPLDAPTTTPELDRLQARSKAAKFALSHSQNDTMSAKKLKMIETEPTTASSNNKSIPGSMGETSLVSPLTKCCNQSSDLQKNDEISPKIKRREIRKLKLAQLINTKNYSMKRTSKIKLKRPCFSTETVESCKISKPAK